MGYVNLAVGQPCPVCGTPAIPGKFGAYCKPCYVQKKNAEEHKPMSLGDQNKNHYNQKPDWDEISRGKVKYGFYLELFKHILNTGGHTKEIKDGTMKDVIDKYTDEVMNGKGKTIEEVWPN